MKKQPIKHIILQGGYCIGSAGDDAPLSVITNLLKDRLNNRVKFTVVARHVLPKFEQDYQVRVCRNLEYDNKNLSNGRFLRGLNPDESPTEVERLIKLYQTADLLILGAGNFINENATGLFRGLLPNFYFNSWIASWVNLPIMLFGLSSSPLKSIYAKHGAQWLLNNANAVTFRDSIAPKNLVTSGLTLPKHTILPDPIFRMKRTPRSEIDKLFYKEGIPFPKANRLSISVRSMLHLGKKEDALYKYKIAFCIENWLRDSPDNDVVFIPQFVYKVDGPHDDISVATEIATTINPILRKRIYHIKGNYLPWETEAFYNMSSVALTTRLHASLFSLRCLIPTIAIAYETKVYGLMETIKYPGKYVIDVKTKKEEIYAKLLDVYRNSNAIMNKTRNEINKCSSMVEKYGDIAIKAMGK